jgi:Na+/H+ antiporter NhaC
MPEGIVSVLPPLVAIILAWATKQIIPALLIGLLAGSYLIEPGLVTGIAKMVEYVEATFLDQGNLDVLLFLYVFSGFVGLLKMSGGIKGFARWIGNITKTKKGTLLAMWATEIVTFLDCAYRVVATGMIFKPLADERGISRERLAFMLNNSASPVVIMIPIATTFVGFMVGTIATGLNVAGQTSSPYIVFLKSIPFNFFSITSILVVISSIVFNVNFKKMRELEWKNTESLNESNSHIKPQPAMDMEMGTMEEMRKTMNNKNNSKTNSKSGRIYNLIIPILLLLPISLYMMWWTGQDEATSFGSAIINAESSRAMFLALVITTVIAAILYLFQGFSLKDLTDNFFKQGNKIIHTIAILAVAWPIADVSKDLGLPQLITATLGENLSEVYVPVIIFVVTSLVSYFIGSSWGTFALLMPIAIPLATVTGGSVAMSIGAVLAGGTFGDVTSPLSGMTVMAAGTAEAEHMEYVEAQMPYNLTAFVLSAALFLIFAIIM